MVYFTPITSHDDAKHHHDAFVAANHDPRMMPFSYTHEGQQHHFAVYNEKNAPKHLFSHIIDGQHLHQITTDQQHLPNLPSDHAIPQPAVAALKAHLQNHQQWFRSEINKLHTFIVPVARVYGHCSQALVLAERLTKHHPSMFVSVVVRPNYIGQVIAKFPSLRSNPHVHIQWWEPSNQNEAYTLIQKLYPKQKFNFVVDFHLPGSALALLAAKWIYMSCISARGAPKTVVIDHREPPQCHAAVFNRLEDVPAVYDGAYFVNPLISIGPAFLSEEQKQMQDRLDRYLAEKLGKSVILVTVDTVMPSGAQEKLLHLIVTVLKDHHVIVATFGPDYAFAHRQPSSLVQRYEKWIGLVIQHAGFSTALEIAAASNVPSLYLPSVVGSIYDAQKFETLGYGFSCVSLPNATHASDPNKIDSKDILDHHEHEGDAAWVRVANKFQNLVKTRVPNATLYSDLCLVTDRAHHKLKDSMATRDAGLEKLCKLLE